MLKAFEYDLEDEFDFSLLRDLPGDAFHINVESGHGELRYFYDSFDGRLLRAGMTLEHCDGRYLVRELHSGNLLREFNWRRKAALKSVRELSDDGLREFLGGILGPRALLPTINMRSHIRECEILNSDDKTVARLREECDWLLPSCGEAKALRHGLRLNPVRGYPGEFEAVARLLAEHGYEHEAEGREAVYMLGLSSAGLSPWDNSSKIRTQLSEEMSALGAATVLCRDMFTAAERNEAGIIDDTDIEFLHDYRVSVRRLRSLLGLLRGVLPKTERNHLKERLAAAARHSNGLRDCDVLMEQREDYTAMLPQELRHGLKAFFRAVSSRRRKEYQALCVYLKSREYAAFKEEFRKFWDGAAALPVCLKTEMPVRDFASRLIFRHFRKLVEAGMEIDRATADAELHQLRIECKKLRYLMECYAPLYEDNLGEAITRMKELQTNLGDFNDLSVQIATLTEKIFRIGGGHRNPPMTAAAIGGLITVLSAEKTRLREEFDRVFGDFSGNRTWEYFRRTFNAEEKA